MDPNARTPRFDSWRWRAGNAVVGWMARLGIGPIHLLTTHSRRSGRDSTVPVVPVEQDGRRWLVAPYGPTGWVRNVRADSRVTLRHGRAAHSYDTREASPAEAGPVLKQYVAVATKTRDRFDAAPSDPAEDFVAEAEQHPVFQLVPTGE